MLGYGGAILALQIFCVIHCIQRNRGRNWIFLIIFAPLIGSVVYLYTEFLPEVKRRGGTTNANPLRYRPAAPKAKKWQSGKAAETIHGREKLADEQMRLGNWVEAAELYRDCLSQGLENDPALLYKLAEACHQLGEHAQAIEALHRVRALTDYRPGKVRLLLARCYAAQNSPDKAQAAFEQALKAQSDPEILCRYALFLQDQDQAAKAQALFIQALSEIEKLSPQEREPYQEWIELATHQTQTAGSPSDAGT